MSAGDSKRLVQQWFGVAMNTGSAEEARSFAEGAHTGEFMAIPASGRRIRHTENEIYRTSDGRVAESWGEGSWLATIRQLQGAEASG